MKKKFIKISLSIVFSVGLTAGITGNASAQAFRCKALQEKLVRQSVSHHLLKLNSIRWQQ